MGMKIHELQHELQQTCAIFGRQKETNLVFEGTSAYTDGKTIVIPAMPEDKEIDDETARMIRGYVDHEAGHIRHTDFEFFIKTKEAGVSDKLGMLWNSTEDIMLEEKVIEEYQGAEKNLRSLTDHINKQEIEFFKSGKADPTIINADTLACCTRAYGRDRHKIESNEDLINLFPENIQVWAKYFAEQSKVAKDTKQTFKIACDMAKALKDDPELKNPPPEQPMDGEGKPDLSDLGEPKDAKEAKDQAESVGEGGEGKSRKEAEEEVYGKGKEGSGKGKSGKVDRPMDPVKEALEKEFGGSGKTFSFAGIDGSKAYVVTSTRNDETYHRSRPAKRANRLHSNMVKASPVNYENVKSRIGGEVNVMKARLRRSLAAKEMRDWDCGRLEGRLDTKRLVHGKLGAENVYKKRSDRLELDTAVHMLLDLSGSMGGQKMVTAAECAIAFAECLEGTPINYQVSGFDNSGSYGTSDKKGLPYFSRSEPLNTYVFKSFSESLHAAKAAMSTLPSAAGGNNSDRDAILWAKTELLKQPNKRKVLLVFSDGQPANYTQGVGYDHLNFHAKKAIKDVEALGIECIGIGIMTNHLGQLYKNYVEINTLKDLAGGMFNKLTQALIQKGVKV